MHAGNMKKNENFGEKMLSKCANFRKFGLLRGIFYVIRGTLMIFNLTKSHVDLFLAQAHEGTIPQFT